MQLRYHGIECNNTDNTGWFRLGILRLLHWLSQGNFRAPVSSANQGRLEWTRKWRQRRFCQITTKFQDTFWKFDRAAGHFNRCVGTVKLHHESRQREDLERFLNALRDIPLYLDLMLFYLRIQADCVASAIPYFYKQQAPIAERSFRDQVKWFTKTRPDFDPEYTAILNSNLDWFELLAGKDPKGLRDVIVHQCGTFQLGWSRHDGADDIELRASLVGNARIVHDNVVPALKSMVTDYFVYLDRIFAYFSAKLRVELGNEGVPTNDIPTRYYEFSNGPLSSHWVYPLITPGSKE